MTNLINIFAGPSAGKSTTAAGLFHWMKDKRMNVEYAPEFAKDIVWDQSFHLLDDQLSILGEQHRRLYRLLGQVDYIITDSPLLLSLVYGRGSMKKFKDVRWRKLFNDLVLNLHHQYNNYNFFTERGDRKYIQAGRTQKLDEAIKKDQEVHEMLCSNYIQYDSIKSYKDIIDILGLK